MSAPTRPVLRYHGGKWMLAPWILSFFPAHRVYVEPFGGAASVLMRKPRTPFCEVLNDLDGEVVSLFRVLRDEVTAMELSRQLALTPYAREEFALSYLAAADPVEQARRTVVRAFMGFGSDSSSGAMTGFRSNGNRQSTHPASDWSNYPRAVRNFTARLQRVVIECRPAEEIIGQHDGPGTLFYCDPPYSHSTRSGNSVRTGKGYRHEMTDEDHRRLAAVLRGVEGMVVLSGYACELYDLELYPEWERHERDHLADGARPRTEVVWLNPACSEARKIGQQGNLGIA